MTSSLAYEMITINGALKEAYDCIVSYNSQRILSYMNETSPYYVNYNQLLILFCHLISSFKGWQIWSLKPLRLCNFAQK